MTNTNPNSEVITDSIHDARVARGDQVADITACVLGIGGLAALSEAIFNFSTDIEPGRAIATGVAGIVGAGVIYVANHRDRTGRQNVE